MIGAILVIIAILTYFCVGGVVGAAMLHALKGRCADCLLGSLCREEHHVAALWTGFFWPLGIGVLLGVLLSPKPVGVLAERKRRLERERDLLAEAELDRLNRLLHKVH